MSDRNISHRRIEEATLSAWPALEQLLLDGWIVRFANGYTRRANSVTSLYPPQMAMEPKITHCERLYAARDLPCIFRLTTACPCPELDALLETRGYAAVAHTAVLTRDLRTPGEPDCGADDLLPHSIAEWLPIFSRLQNAEAIDQQRHGRILAAVPSELLLVTRLAQGREVACGMSVVEGELLGLCDIVTAPGERRRGHATHLVNALLAWGSRRGALRAYLQVMRQNIPARRLYEKLGFRETYEYWYRVPAGVQR